MTTVSWEYVLVCLIQQLPFVDCRLFGSARLLVGLWSVWIFSAAIFSIAVKNYCRYAILHYRIILFLLGHKITRPVFSRAQCFHLPYYYIHKNHICWYYTSNHIFYVNEEIWVIKGSMLMIKVGTNLKLGNIIVSKCLKIQLLTLFWEFVHIKMFTKDSVTLIISRFKQRGMPGLVLHSQRPRWGIH